MRCKIRVTKHLEGVYPLYQPEVGKVYDADYVPKKYRSDGNRSNEFCVIDIKDKRIVLRRDEFELGGDENGF